MAYVENAFGVQGVKLLKPYQEDLLRVFENKNKNQGGRAKAEETAKVFFQHLAHLSRKFDPEREKLLRERDSKALAYYAWCDTQRKEHGTVQENEQKLAKLREVGFLPDPSETFKPKVRTQGLACELQTPGPQLVVPGDKANMVLNALNARYKSLYEATKGSNLLEGELKCPRAYGNAQLDTFLPLTLRKEGGASVPFSQVKALGTSGKNGDELLFLTNDGKVAVLASPGIRYLGFVVKEAPKTKNSKSHHANVEVESYIVEHRRLKVEFVVNNKSPVTNNSETHKKSKEEGAETTFYPLVDVRLESVLTFIIDKEDSSISSPDIKAQSDYNIAGICNGTLSTDLGGNRGVRTMEKNSTYYDVRKGEYKTLKRTALPLVRDVGDHLVFDPRFLTIDGKPIFEKTFDTLMTSFLGITYHVLPKMHGEKEVALSIQQLEEINRLLGLPPQTQKIGVMNEEIETNLKWKRVLKVGRDVIFFTNSGFLDYFGSTIDLLTQEGPFDSYQQLGKAVAKIEYEKNHVRLSLEAGVPQIGAGMWALLDNKKGHKVSKLDQIQQGNDTSWNPDPTFACLHALYYHQSPKTVKQHQEDVLRSQPEPPAINLLVTRPAGNFPQTNGQFTPETASMIQENLDEAIYGLLAYAQPWITQGQGCTAVKTLRGERLMEDRATARIKTAFIRNWLSHKITTRQQVSSTIDRMTEKLKNDLRKDYHEVFTPKQREQVGPWREDLLDCVREAVSSCVYNPKNYQHSYIEEYFYFWRCKYINRIDNYQEVIPVPRLTSSL
eukprot:TRINITY_DN2650_c0_g1_i1.p1 TRINITY_DN2650_c0_g1~~TRINITY_DN2650_c0_g1_i1.p1  ORF type:complete len:792 (-),score=248.13 TRINITY_DN2650_c0_g1_i1:195-2537(-)